MYKFFLIILVTTTLLFGNYGSSCGCEIMLSNQNGIVVEVYNGFDKFETDTVASILNCHRCDEIVFVRKNGLVSVWPKKLFGIKIIRILGKKNKVRGKQKILILNQHQEGYEW